MPLFASVKLIGAGALVVMVMSSLRWRELERPMSVVALSGPIRATRAWAGPCEPSPRRVR